MPGREWTILTQRSNNREILLVFLRSPRLGQVKTRLARDLGPAKALAWYKCFVSRTLAAARAWQMAGTLKGKEVRETWICHTPGADADRVRDWLGQEYRFLAQTGSDLGERMGRAMAAAFDTGAARVLLVGTDIPDMEGPHMEAASNALAGKDLVLGPSLDGGYWLVGACRQGFSRELFQGVPWGSAQVLSATLEQAGILGLTWDLLAPLQDVDTAADLVRTRFYQASLPESAWGRFSKGGPVGAGRSPGGKG